MKKIECIIRPDKLASVEQALRHAWVGGMTISEVKGFGHQRKPAATKVKIELYAMELEVDTLVKTIQQAAYTGKTGDGKIAVLPLDHVMRIRTKEEGAAALL
jgi:nitrogen regulatory protein P-II 1